MLAGCFVPAPAGTWLLAGGAVLLPVALMALGAKKGGRMYGTTRIILPVLALTLAGTLAALIVLHGSGRAGANGLLLQLAGLWFVPLLLTGLGYATCFPRARRSDGADREHSPES